MVRSSPFRGVSLDMLCQARRGNVRRLLALNRDIMLRLLPFSFVFGAITVSGAAGQRYYRKCSPDDLTTFTPSMRWTVALMRWRRTRSGLRRA